MSNDIKYRVLILKNNRAKVDKIKEIILSDYPATVDVVSSSKDAMLQIDYYTFDLIFLEEPGTEGKSYDLTRYISKSFLNSYTPVIYISNERKVPVQKLRDLPEGVLNIISDSIGKEELISIISFCFRFIEKEKNELKDITKRSEHNEAELRKYKDYFRNIVGRTNAGILIIDNNGIIQFVNEAAEQIFLRKREELLGTPFGIILGNQINTEIDIVRKNGEVGIGEISTAKTEWNAKPAKLVLINDITNHKKLQESLEVAKLKAQESDNLKTAFLANMSHEIRTPLNGIIGFSQLLNMTDLDTDKRISFVDTISTCGNQLLSIVNDIIDIAQIESGQLTIAESEFDVLNLMKDVFEVYKLNKKILTNNIALKLEVPDVQTLKIRSDEMRLKQVLFNVLNNAVKFTDEGSITLALEIAEPYILRFYVKDTGIGIPKEEFANIFERFRQVELTKERINEGNGLGLSISKALVNLLGGEIWMESELGKGSTFYFTIKPNINVSFFPLTDDDPIKRSKPALANKKILIVEDEETNFFFIKSLLDACETTIFWAKDGVEAIEIAKKEDIDIILMDMKLPIKSGYEAVREIRIWKPDLPIIAQTAYALSGDKERMLNAGCNDYIAKPIKVRDLLQKMHHYIN